jgi:uncharacterized membrane protein/3-hydroxymyristoyl/3-hydroxydecanoyl-(acyl carrier protein) dehydratase
MPRVFSYLLAVLYPVLVFVSLVILKIPLRYFSIVVVAAAFAVFLGATARTAKSASRKINPLQIAAPALLGALGLACLVSNAALFLKLYPVLMNALMLGAFGFTLISPPPMIFRFAAVADKTIRGSLAEKRIERYCRAVTIVWCAFFVVNGACAAWTVLSGSDMAWSVYNGGVSYILMGMLFAGEFMVRKIIDKRMPRAVPLSAFTPASRPADHIVSYDRSWSGGRYKTWRDFLEDTARLRRVIEAAGADAWILHADDGWYFLCAFTALLQCRREIRLTANISPGYIAEIRGDGAAFITDQPLSEAEAAGAIVYIPDALNAAGEVSAPAAVPPVNAGETTILMYTSGTTGKPKVVRQRLTEFENDNRFILSQWGEAWLARKAAATVSHHHIYGLLFAILLPFTAGVPFRRTRIEAPEELETLRGQPLMLITVPAFLKRALELREHYGLCDPWIYTSGGVLERETAEQTSRAFGFWPVEVYGSTETSGIAWRQSQTGLEWTPFANAEISLNGEGRLLIRSPYIKDPAGFTTGDLAELLADGRFLLKGRADSIVKIEEKRVSLTEVEERLLQSGLVAQAAVLAFSGRRQYLAAALVLNEAGRERFGGVEKHAINRFFRGYLSRFFEPVVLPKKWRYVQALPVNTQGKHDRLAIEALFAAPAPPHDALLARRGLSPVRVLEQSETAVTLEFSVLPESDYFNEHFPSLRVLPAVAQFELAVRFAARYLGTGLDARRAKRLKFSSLVRPGVPLRLKLSKSGHCPIAVDFSFSSPSDGTVYSSGAFSSGGGVPV